MDVTCDKCRTEYEFDDSLISESGTTVKCTNCGHLFRIYKPGTPESKRRPAWLLKQPDGSVYTFERMTTLQRWIAEGKVTRDDQVSRDGEGWQSLGTMNDLAPFFESAKSNLESHGDELSWGDDGPTIRRPSPRTPTAGVKVSPPRAPAPIGVHPPPKAPPPDAHFKPAPLKVPEHSPPPPAAAAAAPAAAVAAPASLEEPVATLANTEAAAPALAEPAADGQWTEGALLKESSPAWTESQEVEGEDDPEWGEGRISSIGIKVTEEEEEEEGSKPLKKVLKVGVPVVLALAALATGVVYLVRPEVFSHLANEIVTSDENIEGDSQAYLRGREFFLLDTTKGFRQADREYHRAPSGDGLIQAGLAEVYSTWAQYYLDEVADYQLRASKAEPTRASALMGKAELRQKEYQEKLQQSRRFVDAALKLAPDTAEAHRAAADYNRLAGEVDRAQEHISEALEHARRQPGVLPETEYVEALVGLASNGDLDAAIAELREVTEQNGKLLRCQFRLARLLGAAGEHDEARARLKKVVALNEEHERARDLLDDMQQETPPMLAVTSMADLDRALTGGLDAGVAAIDGGALEAGVALAAAADAGAGAEEADAATTSNVEDVPSEESFDAVVRRAAELQQNGSREACPMFRRADRIRNGHPEVLVGLGYCATDTGNRSKAISLYRRALISNPTYGPALLALASAYRAQGSNRQALDHYERYLRAHPSGGQAGLARRNIARIEESLEPSEPESSASDAPEPPTKAIVNIPTSPPETSEPEVPPSSTPPTESPSSGTPEAPEVTRITEDHSPPEPRSDSLAVDSEPPLRPGESLD